MSFLKVVEVFPPLVSKSDPDRDPSNQAMGRFARGVKEVSPYADIITVASVNLPGFVQVSPVEAVSLLTRGREVEIAPTIVVRGMSRTGFSSVVLRAVQAGIRTLVLVWGDRDGAATSTGVRGFSSLSEAIGLARRTAEGAGVKCGLLAPTDLGKFPREGVRLARSRLDSGADLLLAQPPTVDPGEDFERHLALLDSTGLRNRTLLGLFPFKNGDDARRIGDRFGWRLPPSFVRLASSEEFDTVAHLRSILSRIRDEGLPGAYLSTRGQPEIAAKVLSAEPP